jgi:Ni/Co efflux regulator RcnB
MSRLKRSRPSPALVVGVLALVAALAGTAVAADPVAQTSISKKKTKRIATNKANKAVEAFAEATFPIGAEELGTIETRTVSQAATNNFVELTANCESGERVLSGGYKTDNAAVNQFNFFPLESHKQGEGWYVRGFVSGTFTATAEAYCLAI